MYNHQPHRISPIEYTPNGTLALGAGRVFRNEVEITSPDSWRPGEETAWLSKSTTSGQDKNPGS